MAEALAGNAEIRAYEAEVAAARGERVSAGAWRNPELSVDLGAKEARDSEDILQGNGIAFGVQVSQTFEWPGKGTLRKAIADRNVALAEMALAQFRRALAARVRGLAAESAALAEKARLADGVAGEGRRIVQALRDRPLAGAQRLIEMRLIEAAIIELRRSALELETQAATVRAELNQLRGAPAFFPLHVDASLLRAAAPGSLPALLAAGGANHPQVRLRALELERAGDRLREARLSAAPDVAIAPFFNREEAGDVETTIGAALSLPLPLWDRGRGQIAAARARSAAGAAALATAQREAETQIAKLHREWASAHQMLADLTPKRIEEFREAAELAARQFRSGGISVQLYLDMQREFLAVAGARVDALAFAVRNAASLSSLTAPPAAIPIPSQTQTSARRKP